MLGRLGSVGVEASAVSPPQTRGCIAGPDPSCRPSHSLAGLLDSPRIGGVGEGKGGRGVGSYALGTMVFAMINLEIIHSLCMSVFLAPSHTLSIISPSISLSSFLFSLDLSSFSSLPPPPFLSSHSLPPIYLFLFLPSSKFHPFFYNIS